MLERVGEGLLEDAEGGQRTSGRQVVELAVDAQLDDLVFFGLIGCVVALVALSIAALVRSMTRSRANS
jgi:hypothetical protein